METKDNPSLPPIIQTPSRRWPPWLLVAGCWGVLAIALAMPPEGAGLSICVFKNLTTLPCPGCGLTRSVSCAVQGLPAKSFAYHPYGFLFAAAFFSVGVLGLFPQSVRESLEKKWQNSSRWLKIVSAAFFVVGIIFGLVRLALVASGQYPQI